MYYNLFVENTNDLFTYEDKNEEYKIGDLVIVSFRGKEKVALIVEKNISEEFSFKTLPIKRLLKSNGYSEKYIKLLQWVREYYLCSYSSIFNLNSEKRVNVQKVTQYRIDIEKSLNSPLEKEIIKYFKKKSEVREVFFQKKFLVSKEMEKEIENLLNSGFLIYESIVIDKSEESLEEKVDIDFRDRISLNPEQNYVKERIKNSNKKLFLLKGITGSGKTEVYISLMRDALEEGKSSLFLVPEIALTPQIISRMRREFGSVVAIFHSKMSEKEKQEEWDLITSGVKKVVLGVRSAIFSPLVNLGYIIIDEEHEGTYKQDSNPRYNAKNVAIKRAEIEGCKIVLGSATPSIESYYYGEKKVFETLRMDRRFNNMSLPDVKIVDLKNSADEIFSSELTEAIKERLEKNEQVIILLNRKGYSTYIQCKECGHIEECSHCSIKNSFYQKENLLKCNYCEIVKPFTGVCSSCGSKELFQGGKGVERIEEELKNRFNVEVIRVDSESSKEKNFHENMYHDFLNGKYKIMVGTQMITKGLHFPNVTLVGVINADMGLSFPDFRSNERTFQLLTQVSGRAGRGDKKGEVIIQTYQPENPIFSDVITGDYESFYLREIEDRKVLFYPPFSRLINIGISSEDEVILEEYCKTLYNYIRCDEVEFYGPMRSLVYKVKNRFRKNILIKGEREKINKFKRELENKLIEFEKNNKNTKVRVVVDVDPINLI